MKKKCEKCSKEFKCYPSADRKYCSRECFETKRPPTNCLECNTKFHIPGQPNQKYCSKECYYKNIKGTFLTSHNYNLGKKHSIKTKEKISTSHRLIRSKWVKDWVQGPMFNVEGCKRILEYGEKHEYKFQTAINGGEYFIKELGYWVDGYYIEGNVVIEYMENHHNTPKHRIKDKMRRERIINHLNCKYIELWE
tara:strand:+ start:189 stop:770 length:582 start_codon:yes stop_codon:yes gene_type:complete